MALDEAPAKTAAGTRTRKRNVTFQTLAQNASIRVGARSGLEGYLKPSAVGCLG
jgi:hypothetical protein